ncbi:dihydropteroate synthase [Microbacterium sp. ET2]|uniref:dihydropteroate synthase n=1 Tax=Microbacterium albipurpureum TaxID=3050384 RepID=UPI00259CC63D|nr:dihydropteroate synthase [Microbacterium sp. ET2 (Ac-2212)]WJL97092.1 dihydropteroate synthase [Microbacterium sp. ET2 (Ac-2212)]
MTVVMGIVNVTPDSFSDGGRYFAQDAAIARGRVLRAAGADILDIGGESTRPGAHRVDPGVEQERVLPVISALAAEGATVSIDTMNASTAVAAVEAGAAIVNDVSGGLADPAMLPAVAGSGAEFVVGHWRGPSSDMYARAEYGDVVREVVTELSARLEAAAIAGIAPSRVILDPGIGFGKRGDQNWSVLSGLPRILGIGPRVLIGTSRKRFLAETLVSGGAAGAPTATLDDASEERRDLATAVTSALAAREGVWGVRVHDVRATRDALLIAEAWEGDRRWTATRSR